MQCANCHNDFKSDENKGYYTQQNNHFMRPYRVHGMACPHCGFHNTVFQIPVRVLFLRTSKTYDTLDAIVEEFRKNAENFLNKGKSNDQLTLDIFEEDE